MTNKSKSTRIAISCPDDIYAILSDWSELTGKPMSRVLVEFLDRHIGQLYEDMSMLKHDWLLKHAGADLAGQYHEEAKQQIDILNNGGGLIRSGASKAETC